MVCSWFSAVKSLATVVSRVAVVAARRAWVSVRREMAASRSRRRGWVSGSCWRGWSVSWESLACLYGCEAACPSGCEAPLFRSVLTPVDVAESDQCIAFWIFLGTHIFLGVIELDLGDNAGREAVQCGCGAIHRLAKGVELCSHNLRVDIFLDGVFLDVVGRRTPAEGVDLEIHCSFLRVTLKSRDGAGERG